MRFPAKIISSCIWVAIPVDWVILHWYTCVADGRSGFKGGQGFSKGGGLIWEGGLIEDIRYVHCCQPVKGHKLACQDHWYKSVHQAPVVQTLDSAIHRVKIYPVNNAIDFPNTYPLDSAIQRLSNRGQKDKTLLLVQPTGHYSPRRQTSVIQQWWNKLANQSQVTEPNVRQL